MWQDYIGIVPGIAAAVMGIVTLARQKMPHWQKWLIVCLTVVAIGATGFTQWWALHQKTVEQAERTAILETLGNLIDEGNALIPKILNSSDKSVPVFEVNDWRDKSENFLKTLGKSYVIRFRSDAGINSVRYNVTDEQNNWLEFIRTRLIRLHEFSSEYAGQIPKVAGGNLF
jgi:hypothetical protein